MSVDEDRKLFVAGLSDAATEETLRGAFADAGFSNVEVSLPRDRATGRARGFGFVTLETKDQAEHALEQLNGIIVDGRAISVRVFRSDRTRPARPGGERPFEPRGGAPSGRGFEPRGADSRGPRPGGRPGNDDSTVYVGNLPFDALEPDVTAFFNEQGFDTVRRVHLPTDPDGRRRGFGFVTLEDEAAAKRAAESLDGTSFRGRQLGVNLARRGGGGAASGASGGPRSHGGAPRGPSSWSGPAPSSGGGEGQASSWRPRPARSFDPPPPETSGDAPPREEGGEWRGKKDRRPVKDKVKDKKAKKGRGLASERPGAPKQRRRNEEFRSSRAKDYLDDWDDD
jgi:RNA recognition motif-containing protein